MEDLTLPINTHKHACQRCNGRRAAEPVVTVQLGGGGRSGGGGVDGGVHPRSRTVSRSCGLPGCSLCAALEQDISTAHRLHVMRAAHDLATITVSASADANAAAMGAVATIQRFYRGCRARRWIHTIRRARQVRLQAQVDVVRSAEIKSWLGRAILAAVRVQRAARAWLLRRELARRVAGSRYVRQTFLAGRAALRFLWRHFAQKAKYAFCDRQEARCLYGALRIQLWWRAQAARRRVAALRERARLPRAALLISCLVRRHTARCRVVRVRFAHHLRRIQRVWRGRRPREALAVEELVAAYAAGVLESRAFGPMLRNMGRCFAALTSRSDRTGLSAPGICYKSSDPLSRRRRREELAFAREVLLVVLLRRVAPRAARRRQRDAAKERGGVFNRGDPANVWPAADALEEELGGVAVGAVQDLGVKLWRLQAFLRLVALPALKLERTRRAWMAGFARHAYQRHAADRDRLDGLVARRESAEIKLTDLHRRQRGWAATGQAAFAVWLVGPEVAEDIAGRAADAAEDHRTKMVEWRRIVKDDGIAKMVCGDYLGRGLLEAVASRRRVARRGGSPTLSASGSSDGGNGGGGGGGQGPAVAAAGEWDPLVLRKIKSPSPTSAVAGAASKAAATAAVSVTRRLRGFKSGLSSNAKGAAPTKPKPTRPPNSEKKEKKKKATLSFRPKKKKASRETLAEANLEASGNVFTRKRQAKRAARATLEAGAGGSASPPPAEARKQ